MQISWDAVQNITGYEIEVDGNIINTDLMTEYEHIGLIPETYHTYRVRAININGESEWTELILKQTTPITQNPPGIPVNIHAIATDTGFKIMWVIEDNTADYFEVEVDGKEVQTNITTPHVLISGLQAGTTHSFKVRAINSKGASEWSELLTVSLTNYADEIDRILKLVEALLPNLKNTDIIQKAQELLDSAINLMPKVSEGPVKDSLAARIQKAQDAINVADIDVKLTILENMLPNISTLDPIKTSLEQIQVEVNGLPIRLDEAKKAFQIRIDDIYKRFSNSWYTKPFMESAKSKAAVLYSDEKIYAIGGIISSNVYSDEIEMFDTNTNNKWVVLTKMPGGARQGMTAASVDGKIYIIGGKQGSTILKTVEVYNTNTNTWEENKVDMPTARQGAVCAVVDGKIYVIGGSSSSKYFKTVEVYDPATNTWATKKSMAIARDTAGVAVIDNKIYVVGGYKGSSIYLNDVEAYDPAQDIWETKAPMNTARRALGVCQVNGLIYAIGGLNTDGDLNTVEVYNPSTNEWQTKKEMTMNRSYLSAVTVKGSLYGIGGTNNGNPVNTVEQFIP
jgi:N-acetylneuraminic acid mutarotase